MVIPASIIFTWSLGDTYDHTTLHIPLNFLDLLNRKDSTVPDSVVCILYDQKVAWRAHPSISPQYDHWVSHTYLFHLFRCNADHCQRFDLTRFPTFGCLSIFKARLVVCILIGSCLSRCKTNLVVNILIGWVKCYYLCLLTSIPSYGRGYQFEIFPYFKKHSIHAGLCEL